jgi:hypothetical protein
VQEAVNGAVYYHNTQDTGSSSGLNNNYFTVVAIADSLSEISSLLTTDASLVEATAQSAAEFAHSFGVAGLAFGTFADFTSLRSGGISLTQFNVNLGVGLGGLAGGALTVLPSTQYFLAHGFIIIFIPENLSKVGKTWVARSTRCRATDWDLKMLQPRKLLAFAFWELRGVLNAISPDGWVDWRAMGLLVCTQVGLILNFFGIASILLRHSLIPTHGFVLTLFGVFCPWQSPQ